MDVSKLCGWVPSPRERDAFASQQPFPVFGDASDAIKGSGKGKEAMLRALELELFGDYREPNFQTTGDCVSMAVAQAGEDLEIVDMTERQISKDKFEKVATEPIYGGGRVEIGGGRLFGAGMVVAWAIDWGKRWGLLPRRRYGEIDLTRYDGNRADAWGRPRNGCPDIIEPEAKKYPIITCSLVQGNQKYEQCRDAIYNKAIIVTGSNQLFSQSRGRDGFITPSGRGGHSTRYNGFTDNDRRPGIWYDNSWGSSYHVGPEMVTLPSGTEMKVPKGGGFIDADEFDRIHRNPQDEVWVISKTTAYVINPAPDIYQIKFF